MTPNTHFATYDASGRILTTGVCQVETLELQGPLVYAGLVDPATHRIDVESGLPVALPPQPSPHHRFDYNAMEWALDAGSAWAAVRRQRETLIAATDWTALPDSPLTPEQRSSFIEYRQALRDITDQPDPTNIVWPTPPT